MTNTQEEIEKGAKILQQHDQWLAQNLDQLIETYPGKIVAVGDTYKEVYAPFQNQNRDWMPLAVRVPYPDEIQELLI
jgi:hypothetical protein